jgi:hypothetical protein
MVKAKLSAEISQILTEKIPPKMLTYLIKNFEDGFVSDILEFKDSNGQTAYQAEISDDHLLYHLKFSIRGVLIDQETEPIVDNNTSEEIDGPNDIYD